MQNIFLATFIFDSAERFMLPTMGWRFLRGLVPAFDIRHRFSTIARRQKTCMPQFASVAAVPCCSDGCRASCVDKPLIAHGRIEPVLVEAPAGCPNLA